MALVKVYDQSKQEAGEINLDSSVFEVEIRPEILNLVVRAQRAAKRAGTHAAKERGQVSGGGKKPFAQKGTGRARAGSNRSPLWRGGAVLFAPKPRDYSFKVNKKVRSLAFRMALSSRLADDSLMVVKDIDLAEIKTKAFIKVAGDLGLNKALLVAPAANEKLSLSARNVPGITVVTPGQLTVYDILRHTQLVLLEETVAPVEARFKQD